MKKVKIELVVLFRNFLFLTLLSVVLFSCSKKKPEAGELYKFQVLHPIVTDTSVSNEYIADVHSLKNVEIRARVNGYLENILVDEGQTVKKGQVLFTINSQEYKDELVKAKANLSSSISDAKATEVEVANTKVLVDKNVVSASELEMIRAKLDMLNAKIDEARSDVHSAELNLSYTEIKAPFDGVIDRIPFKPGSLIDEGSLLTTISDNNEVYAYFNVSEQEYLNVLKSNIADGNNEVGLILANNQEYSLKGKIETTASEYDKSTGNISFRASFKNPESILKNGSSAKVVLRREVKNAVLIPQKCTFELQDRNYVYVVDSKNVVHLRNFEPKYRISNFYIVDSGLSSNDSVIYEGIQQLKEGDKVTAEVIPFSQVTKLLAEL